MAKRTSMGWKRRRSQAPSAVRDLPEQASARHKKPSSRSNALKKRKHIGKASGARARFRADKPRRAGGGDIQAEPLPPLVRNIPATDIPDQSQSEEANIGTTHHDTDFNMPNAFDTSPNKDMDRAGAPRVDPQNYPGILNAPLRGSVKPHRFTPYRR
jgi:hypothetical protein